MLDISNKLLKEIELYCKANEIDNLNSFIEKLIEIGFNIEKYGTKPTINNEKKEVVKEEPIVEEVKIIENKITKKDDYKTYDF
jgi:hypothetical protein